MNLEGNQEAYEAALDIADNFSHEYIDVIGVWHECQRTPPDEEWTGDLPEHSVRVAVDCVDGYVAVGPSRNSDEPYGSVFTYPLVEYARDLGLYLFDVVVQVGYEADERTIYPRPTEKGENAMTEAFVELRFGLESDREQ